MNVFSAFKTGLKLLTQHWKMWGLVYLLNLLFGLIVALPFNALFKSGVAYSMSPAESLKRFDYSFIMDFLNQNGFAFSSLLNSSYFVLIPFFLLNVFLMGGITGSFVKHKEQFSFRHFWQEGGLYFWRMLRLTFYFMLIHGFVALIFFKIFSLGGLSPFEIESDSVLISRFHWLAFFYGLFLVIIFLIHDYVKVRLVKEDRSIFTQSFLNVFPFIGKYFLKVFPLFLIHVLLFAVLTGAYVLIRKSFFMSSEGTLLLALILGQFFIIGRIGIKLLRISTAVAATEQAQEELIA